MINIEKQTNVHVSAKHGDNQSSGSAQELTKKGDTQKERNDNGVILNLNYYNYYYLRGLIIKLKFI